MRHACVVPAGLDGNANPAVSAKRTAVLNLVASEIVVAARRHGRAMVAIDGASGSGKSTFADELAATLEVSGNQVVRASIDSFHRPRRERYRLGADSPDGYYRESHDIEGLVHELLRPFRVARAGTGSPCSMNHPTDRSKVRLSSYPTEQS